jgi:hypothetical protein
MFIIVVILSNGLMKSLLNSVLDKDGGLYKPDINHFILFILSSLEFLIIGWLNLWYVGVRKVYFPKRNVWYFSSYKYSSSIYNGGLYKPDINHFILFILSSLDIDSTFWNSKFCHKLSLTWHTLPNLLHIVSCLLATNESHLL